MWAMGQQSLSCFPIMLNDLRFWRLFFREIPFSVPHCTGLSYPTVGNFSPCRSPRSRHRRYPHERNRALCSRTACPNPSPPGKDFLPLKGTDHVEFYVGNARQAAYFYRAAFGMSLVAYAGPETGQRDRASYVLQQGKIRFVLTTPLRGGNAIAEHVGRHGDGVKVIALWVDDARRAWRETTSRGAVSVAQPYVLADERGQVVMSSIRTYGDTIHTFVERGEYSGAFPARISCGRARPDRASHRPAPHRPHGRQRGLARDGRVGQVLRERHGLLALPALRRQGHLDRILGADVEGDGERQRLRQVPHQ